MAIFVRHDHPKVLWNLITAVLKKKTGIPTWKLNADGALTHSTKTEQWDDFHVIAAVEPRYLAFYITSDSVSHDRRTFAALQGRWVTALVSHFLDGEEVTVTSAPQRDDTPFV